MSVSIAQGTDEDEHLVNSSESKQSTGYPLFLDTESFRLYLSSVASRLKDRVTVDTLRPLPLFLGITGPNAFCLSPGAFTPPTKHVDKSMLEKIRARLSLNCAFFLSNYALVAFGVAVVVALSHPGMLLFVSLVWALWSLHTFLIDHEVIVFGTNVGMLISISLRSKILTVLTFLVLIWKCLFPVISFVMISGVIILSHALMRDPKHIESSSEFRQGSEDSDEEEVMVERGDVI